MKGPQTENESSSPEAITWLEDLSAGLKLTQARIEGRSVSLQDGFQRLVEILLETKARENMIYWAANGGSTSIASHISQDYLNKLDMRSVTLSDPSLLTCISNDFGYENSYALPLSKLVKKGDLLIAISSSGKSANILKACETVTTLGGQVVSLSGFSPDNPLWQKNSALSFYYPATDYGLVEIGHSALLHAIIDPAKKMSQSLKKLGHA